MLTKTKWVIDPNHSEIGFTVKHMMFSNIKGSFRRFGASVYTNGNDFKMADIDFSIDPSSIDTGNADRDKQLKSIEYFNVDKYRKITFYGTLENTERNINYELWGNLTIKGITKRIKLDVKFGGLIKDSSGSEKAFFTVNGKINRKDAGLIGNASLAGNGVMVSEEVKITCKVELRKLAEDLKMRSEMPYEETIIEEDSIPAAI